MQRALRMVPDLLHRPLNREFAVVVVPTVRTYHVPGTHRADTERRRETTRSDYVHDIGATTIDDLDLDRIEREAARLHAGGILDERDLDQRLAVVAGIRRVRATGRDDLARSLLRAWLDHADATA